MSSWGKKIKFVTPKFFKGYGLLSESTKCMYDNFMKIVNDIVVTNNSLSYEVPKVIVIGAESSGKSSLMENITKCPIFPRNSGICTRQPIHLKLAGLNGDEEPEYVIKHNGDEINVSKTKIVKELENIMNILGEDVCDNVITVYIKDKNLPNFEFIDLPG